MQVEQRAARRAEIAYWLGVLILLNAVLGVTHVAANSWWPDHRGAIDSTYAALFVLGLAALVVRRQKRTGKAPYSLARAAGVALVAFFALPVLLIVGITLANTVSK